jgi:AraC family transcriptional regulator
MLHAMKLLRTFAGAVIRRVIDRSHACVPEHSHDWPVLSIFVLGGYRNLTEAGERHIEAPSAVLYGPRAAHRNTACAAGFEQIEIEFDPAWLGTSMVPTTPVTHWIGGSAGSEARTLAGICRTERSEENVRRAIRRFLASAARGPAPRPAPWVSVVARRLQEDPSLGVAELARRVGRHPSWLGAAFRRATGEGLLEARARYRLERASRLLRETDQALAGVAIEAGFCDQSHMNRSFQRLLGRPPSAVREDRLFLRQS